MSSVGVFITHSRLYIKYNIDAYISHSTAHPQHILTLYFHLYCTKDIPTRNIHTVSLDLISCGKEQAACDLSFLENSSLNIIITEATQERQVNGMKSTQIKLATM